VRRSQRGLVPKTPETPEIPEIPKIPKIPGIWQVRARLAR